MAPGKRMYYNSRIPYHRVLGTMQEYQEMDSRDAPDNWYWIHIHDPATFLKAFRGVFWRIWWHLQKVLKDMTPKTICNGNLHFIVKSDGNFTSIECQVLSRVLLISVKRQKIFAENWVKVVILAEWTNVFWYTVSFWFFKNNFPIYHKNRKWVTMGNNGPPHKWPSKNTWFKKWLQWNEPLNVSHHDPVKFGTHRHCNIGDILVLVCHTISLDHVIKGSCDFKGGKPIKVSYHTAKLGRHGLAGSGDITVFIWHVTLQNHMIKTSNDFLVSSPSRYVTIFPSLVVMGTLVEEI